MGKAFSKVPSYEVVANQVSEAENAPAANVASSSSSSSRQASAPAWAPLQHGPPPPLPPGWEFSVDPSTGYPYFFNRQTGVSQWEDPRGPGWGLPEQAEAVLFDERRQVIPPWEGGPALGDPLLWPMPPGWKEDVDPTSGRRYFVNHAARIMSFSDPRFEIAKAFARQSTVQGVPVNYPPPFLDGASGSSSQSTHPQVSFSPTQSPLPPRSCSWSFPPPPPPRRKRKSLWSRLGYRHGRGLVGQDSSLLQLGLLSGIIDGSSIADPGDAYHPSSSSSSESDSDAEGNEDQNIFFNTGAGGAALSGRSSSSDLTGDGDGNDDQDALDEYGVDLGANGGAVVSNGNMEGNSGGGTGVAALPGGFGNFAVSLAYGLQIQSGKKGLQFASRSIKKRKLSQLQSNFFLRNSWATKAYLKWWFFLIMIVGVFISLLEELLFGFLSRILFILVRKGLQIAKWWQRNRKRKHGLISWIWRTEIVQRILTGAVISTTTQVQVFCFEHLYNHPHAQVKLLTLKDGAAPLHSKLPPRMREITIVTQASADRLPAIKAMATSWGGAMSVVIYVRTRKELLHIYPTLCDLHEQIEALGHCRLEICMAMEEGVSQNEKTLYPVNALRNLALSMAKSELVFILDADFVPSQGMHDMLTSDPNIFREILRMAKSEHQMLVVPAFEAKIEDFSSSAVTFPKTIAELRDKWNNGTAQGFHCSHFPRGHQPTDYEFFLKPSTTKPYMVDYREYYEPYLICARELIPQFDTRFRGYGMNKIAHAYHCATRGFGFTVLPCVYVWSLPHRKSEAWAYTFGTTKDPLQRLRILGLYRRFKSEVGLPAQLNHRRKYSCCESLEIKVEVPLLSRG